MLDPGDVAAEDLVGLRAGVPGDLPDLGGPVVAQMVQDLLLEPVVGVQGGLLSVPVGCPKEGIKCEAIRDHGHDDGYNG